jgi:hypothetical protein
MKRYPPCVRSSGILAFAAAWALAGPAVSAAADTVDDAVRGEFRAAYAAAAVGSSAAAEDSEALRGYLLYP